MTEAQIKRMDEVVQFYVADLSFKFLRNPAGDVSQLLYLRVVMN